MRSRGVTLWRVSNYASLSGVGGMRTAGRWHSRGHPVIYCSEDPSTALLEILVHMEVDAEDLPPTFQVLKIVSTQDVSRERPALKILRSDWRNDLAATRHAGDLWLRSGNSLLLQVPSVLVPERHNYLVNPLHAEMKKLQIAAAYRHPFDPRLLR